MRALNRVTSILLSPCNFMPRYTAHRHRAHFAIGQVNSPRHRMVSPMGSLYIRILMICRGICCCCCFSMTSFFCFRLSSALTVLPNLPLYSSISIHLPAMTIDFITSIQRKSRSITVPVKLNCSCLRFALCPFYFTTLSILPCPMSLFMHFINRLI